MLVDMDDHIQQVNIIKGNLEVRTEGMGNNDVDILENIKEPSYDDYSS